jgi:hypothetical protein
MFKMTLAVTILKVVLTCVRALTVIIFTISEYEKPKCTRKKAYIIHLNNLNF